MTARRDRETLDYEERQERFWEKQDRRKRKLLAETEWVCANRHEPQAMTTDDDGHWYCQRCGSREDDDFT